MLYRKPALEATAKIFRLMRRWPSGDIAAASFAGYFGADDEMCFDGHLR